MAIQNIRASVEPGTYRAEVRVRRGMLAKRGAGAHAAVLFTSSDDRSLLLGVWDGDAEPGESADVVRVPGSQLIAYLDGQDAEISPGDRLVASDTIPGALMVQPVEDEEDPILIADAPSSGAEGAQCPAVLVDSRGGGAGVVDLATAYEAGGGNGGAGNLLGLSDVGMSEPIIGQLAEGEDAFLIRDAATSQPRAALGSFDANRWGLVGRDTAADSILVVRGGDGDGEDADGQPVEVVAGAGSGTGNDAVTTVKGGGSSAVLRAYSDNTTLGPLAGWDISIPSGGTIYATVEALTYEDPDAQERLILNTAGVGEGESVLYSPSGSRRVYVNDTYAQLKADQSQILMDAANIYVNAAGAASAAIAVSATSVGGAPKLGFFGTASIAKPTGVAVTAAAIHAALVSLGLIDP